MKRKTIYQRLVVLILLALVGFGSFGSPSYAQEARSVETEGTIHFTGVWIDPNQPDPPPPNPGLPEDIAKPPAGGQRLPQTNTIHRAIWIWVGVLLVIFVIVYWQSQTKEKKIYEEEKKVGIY